MAGAVTHADSRERRQFERLAVAVAHPSVRARVRPGRDVWLIDVGRGGALVQATSRLLPGSQVELQLRIGDWHWSASGQVVRCHVWALALDEQVRYRAALQFGGPADWSEPGLQDVLRQAVAHSEDGYSLPATGSGDAR
jgi:hypothetical protein